MPEAQNCPSSFRAGNLLAEFLGKMAVNGRDIDADFFEYASMHDGYFTATAITLVRWALPRLTFKTAGRKMRMLCSLQFIFDLFERSADLVAQFAEPRGSLALLRFRERNCGVRFRRFGRRGSCKFSRFALALQLARLLRSWPHSSERIPGCIGMIRRASAARMNIIWHACAFTPDQQNIIRSEKSKSYMAMCRFCCQQNQTPFARVALKFIP